MHQWAHSSSVAQEQQTDMQAPAVGMRALKSPDHWRMQDLQQQVRHCMHGDVLHELHGLYMLRDKVLGSMAVCMLQFHGPTLTSPHV